MYNENKKCIKKKILLTKEAVRTERCSKIDGQIEKKEEG